MVRYAPVPDHPRWRVFREMVRAFTEPADVLRAAFADVPGVEGAFVHGSYARGTDVHPGSDVDVFVIGEAMEDAEARVELAGRTLEAAGLLGREVNVTRYTPRKLATRWASGARFVRSVLTGDKEWIVGDESVLSGVEGAEP
jgi:predicted nucleotidyltransferase